MTKNFNKTKTAFSMKSNSFVKKVFMCFSCAILIFILAQPLHAGEINRCIGKASMKYNVPKDVIELVALHLENGRVGMKKNNNNKSYDMGIMQINSIHLPELSKYGISENDLINNACTNIDVGTWLLAKHIASTGSYAKGIGRYHSKTDKHFIKYLGRAKNILNGANK